MQKSLSPIIVFKNEGENVEKTLASIKETATGQLSILLVDDCSDDGFDYAELAKRYNARYHRMDKPCGSVGTKDWGARNCDSEHFVLLDGHMKFFHKGWDERLVALLEQHPKSIISSRTVYMKSGTNGEWEVQNEDFDPNHHGLSMCCYITWDKGYEFDPKWTDKEIPTTDHDLYHVACVLGACYGCSKSWWEEIDGFNGLIEYGLEESFMSIKTWLMGGECIVVKDWGVGHLYRDVRPSNVVVDPAAIDANRLFLSLFFKPQEHDLYTQNLRERLGEQAFERVHEKFIQMKHDTRLDFWQKAKYDISLFEEINKKVSQ